ncbi:class I SAM-dependent methyltransferase [Aquicoccus sp.]|uniref:class I SAM-dependent methyltransferase n=1 Tax=Aquicoccus sp. TaxID=2055851 RepID=UPI0035637234
MKELETILRDRILAQGPIPVADFMAECLLNPRFGYYTTRDPLGTAGDFTTAPEISQMFGELLGLSLAQAWLDQGAPAPFTLAELGPGRGTLMADILRATRTVPGFHDAANIWLVEASEPLRSTQESTLAGHRVEWTDRIETLPDHPLFLVANEFFDALPIHQFIRHGDGWRERRIGFEDGQFTFVLAPPAPEPMLSHRLSDTRDDDLVEVAPAAAAISKSIGRGIEAHGGAALLIDYGDWHSLGDTLQALHRHKPSNPLENMGDSDLTAHVDFEVLARASPSAHTRLTPQGVFLERLGITQRAKALAEHLDGKLLQSHIAAHRRLTRPSEMGTLFKVLGLYPKSAKPPPGLEP